MVAKDFQVTNMEHLSIIKDAIESLTQETVSKLVGRGYTKMQTFLEGMIWLDN